MATEPPLYVTDPEKWLHEISEKNDFVGVVIFRGSWCKFDRYYLQKLGDFSKKHMSDQNLHLIAWTGEGVDGAKKADEEWGLTKDHGFTEVLGDNTLALAKYLVDDTLLEKLVTSTIKDVQLENKTVSQETYPNGIVQPGMIWYAHHGSVVVQWEAVDEPFASDRPHPKDLFEQVLKRKHALDKGLSVIPVHGRKLKQCCSASEVNIAGCTLM